MNFYRKNKSFCHIVDFQITQSGISRGMKTLIAILVVALGFSVIALADSTDDAFRLMMQQNRITRSKVEKHENSKAKRAKLSRNLRETVVSR